MLNELFVFILFAKIIKNERLIVTGRNKLGCTSEFLIVFILKIIFNVTVEEETVLYLNLASNFILLSLHKTL